MEDVVNIDCTYQILPTTSSPERRLYVLLDVLRTQLLPSVGLVLQGYMFQYVGIL